MNPEEQTDWIIEYYIHYPPRECVCIDDVDIINAEVMQMISEWDTQEIARRYHKLKDTKKGQEIDEYLKEIRKRYLKLNKKRHENERKERNAGDNKSDSKDD